MSAIERITKASHLIDMKDIIREGNPTLRAVAEEVTFPLVIRYHSRRENDAIFETFTRPSYG